MSADGIFGLIAIGILSLALIVISFISFILLLGD
jgi:hypothetical protein